MYLGRQNKEGDPLHSGERNLVLYKVGVQPPGEPLLEVQGGGLLPIYRLFSRDWSYESMHGQWSNRLSEVRGAVDVQRWIKYLFILNYCNRQSSTIL